MSAIRVVLADSHRLVRDGLRKFLLDSHTIDVVAEASDGAQALDLILSTLPDVAIVDDQLPGGCCVEVTRHLRAAGLTIGILVAITFEDSPYIRASLTAGANGFVLKSADAAEIVEAVHAVYDASRMAAHLRHTDASRAP